MNIREHTNAASLMEAVEILQGAGGRAAMVAGGTDLLGILKDDVLSEPPTFLVNLKTLAELDYVEDLGDEIRIGALTSLANIETNPAIRAKYPILAEAAHSVASPQIRNMGTVGGNICQAPRCWYYRAPEDRFHCMRKGGTSCDAFNGENRYHSVFGAAQVGAPPCSLACPAEVPIADYLEQYRTGNMLEAARSLLSANPLPAITGRVCPHYCEQDCNRGSHDESVSVRAIERYVGDYILSRTEELFAAPVVESGKKVAVVGSGPTGLSAAFYLRRAGHTVTVLEREPQPGGMLTYAIPAYRLPEQTLQQELDAIVAMGVEFKCGVTVGSAPSLDDLRSQFDAVLLAVGAWGQPQLGLDNEELLRSGLAFLRGTREGRREKLTEPVVVIGGGNVAVDVALGARRLGAEDVTMVCLECEEEMPALSWELELARSEGVKLHTSWGPARILTNDGRVSGLELVHCTCVFDGQGNFDPQFDQSTRQTIVAGTVFLAIGQKTELDVLDPRGLLGGNRRYVTVDPATQGTSLPGVFAGGDVVSGPATVVAALAAGRRAAAALDAYVKGNPLERKIPTPFRLKEFSPTCLAHSLHSAMQELPIASRSLDTEDALGLSAAEADREADRCFNCGCVAVNASDLAPALIALGALVKTSRRTIQAGEFFMAQPGRTTVLDDDEVVTEVAVPAPPEGSIQSFIKFRIRHSIDFPIVSVASLVSIQSDTVSEARIVLGAVAPIPLRAAAAEAYVVGKAMSEDVAKEAAILATEGIVPLADNEFKAQIARALVRRSLRV